MPFIRAQPEAPAKAFGLATPSHVYSKLLWELANLKASEAAEEKGDGLRFDSAFHAYNFAVTAWHLIDWVWASADAERRRYVSEYFGGVELQKKGQLFDAIADRHRAIHICGQIANGSKHYLATWGEDPEIEAKVLWIRNHEDPATAQTARPIVQRKLVIRDGNDLRPALDIFKDAVRAWASMLSDWGFIEAPYIGPDADPPPWA